MDFDKNGSRLIATVRGRESARMSVKVERIRRAIKIDERSNFVTGRARKEEEEKWPHYPRFVESYAHKFARCVIIARLFARSFRLSALASHAVTIQQMHIMVCLCLCVCVSIDSRACVGELVFLRRSCTW